jgi:salicylate hydroxylase
LRDGNEFNWILTHKETEDIKESWFQPDDYKDQIPSWTSRSHKIVLLGDSCHPYLPTSAQGAPQATESAAFLALFEACWEGEYSISGKFYVVVLLS